MGLVVQKFGGSSVANAERVFNVARIVTDTYREGSDVVVVVSAQGDTTDDLIEKAKEINPQCSKRELDVLLTAGEQMSISLLAMAIERLGYPVVSLLGGRPVFRLIRHTAARESNQSKQTVCARSWTRGISSLLRDFRESTNMTM